MKNSVTAEKIKILHSIELHNYFATRSLRKNLEIYNFTSKKIENKNSLKDFKKLEKELLK